MSANSGSGIPRTEANAAVLLLNLGTPAAPTASAVRHYLAEFLSDRRVIDYPRWLWLPLLYGAILRVRPRRSARAYAKIWTPQGSPLLVNSQNLANRLSAHLGDRTRVALAMRWLPARRAVARRPLKPASRGAALLLGCWVLVIALSQWMPYDFSSNRGMIRAKIAALSFVPFGGYVGGSDLNALNDLLVKLALAAPVGVLAAFIHRRRSLPALTVPIALGLFTALFTIVEAGQLFLPTRSPDPTDVAVGVLGALGGLFLGRWIKEE